MAACECVHLFIVLAKYLINQWLLFVETLRNKLYAHLQLISFYIKLISSVQPLRKHKKLLWLSQFCTY